MISTQYSPETYTGDGTTANLAFTWRILAKSDVVVLAKDSAGAVTTLALDSDYTIADADVNTDDGGNVVLATPATWDTQDIFIIRNTARTQLVNIEEGSAFPAASIVKEFDRLTMIAQEAYYRERKALKFANASIIVDIDVPDPENGTFLGWLNSVLVNGNLGDMGDQVTLVGGEETYDVVFDSPLLNANYQIVAITTTWSTTTEWSAKLTTGFTITFGNAAPAGAKFVWRIIRA